MFIASRAEKRESDSYRFLFKYMEHPNIGVLDFFTMTAFCLTTNCWHYSMKYYFFEKQIMMVVTKRNNAQVRSVSMFDVFTLGRKHNNNWQKPSSVKQFFVQNKGDSPNINKPKVQSKSISEKGKHTLFSIVSFSIFRIFALTNYVFVPL